MADNKIPLKIRQSDLVGDCVRLNRRFELIESGATIRSSGGSNPTPMVQPATANLVLSTSFQPVPGMSLTLTRAGWWKFDVTIEASPMSTDTATRVCVVAGAITLPGIIEVLSTVATGFIVTLHRPWIYNSQTGNDFIEVQAKKNSGAGASSVLGTSTTSGQVSQIVAVWIGP